MFKESAGFFDVRDIAQRAITEGATLDEVTLVFAAELKSALPNLLAKLLNDNGAEYYKSKVATKPLVQVVFAHVEDGLIKARYLGFIVREPKTPVQIVRRDCPGNCPNPGADFVQVGERRAIDRELARDPSIWLRLGVPRAFEKLIARQADSSPQIVGVRLQSFGC
jgi:hypothetical protein